MGIYAHHKTKPAPVLTETGLPTRARAARKAGCLRNDHRAASLSWCSRRSSPGDMLIGNMPPIVLRGPRLGVPPEVGERSPLWWRHQYLPWSPLHPPSCFRMSLPGRWKLRFMSYPSIDRIARRSGHGYGERLLATAARVRPSPQLNPEGRTRLAGISACAKYVLLP